MHRAGGARRQHERLATVERAWPVHVAQKVVQGGVIGPHRGQVDRLARPGDGAHVLSDGVDPFVEGVVEGVVLSPADEVLVQRLAGIAQQKDHRQRAAHPGAAGSPRDPGSQAVEPGTYQQAERGHGPDGALEAGGVVGEDAGEQHDAEPAEQEDGLGARPPARER